MCFKDHKSWNSPIHHITTIARHKSLLQNSTLLKINEVVTTTVVAMQAGKIPPSTAH